ncbi:NADP-dependent 3-hydroxy acid dehydrogenase YdfG [Pseudoxanthomonas sp. GM95]|nr:NADP-dependent 3-hydroxy acid dehydrogenase YdfG [Pseudoxanthomonas sp. GM95]
MQITNVGTAALEVRMGSTQKVAVVTGATRGIGLETARQLAQEGVRVYLAGRDWPRAVASALCLRAEGLDVEALCLDVTDAGSIDAAAASICAWHDKLDILVNNAGVMVDDPARKPSAQRLDVWRHTFDTNLFGLIAVTQAFLPLLRLAPSATIVNVSSLLGSLSLHTKEASPSYDFNTPAYIVSKAAVNTWTLQLAWELRDTNIRVNAVHPGYVRTDMNRGEGDIDVPLGARSSVDLALIGPAGPHGTYSYLGEALAW